MYPGGVNIINLVTFIERLHHQISGQGPGIS